MERLIENSATLIIVLVLLQSTGIAKVEVEFFSECNLLLLVVKAGIAKVKGVRMLLIKPNSQNYV